jgi:TPR repeat protein
MAQFNLGWINARGLVSSEGLMQDMDVAKAWFEKSAKLGFKDAVVVLQNDF